MIQYRILLLVSSKAGYLALCELLTQAWLTNAYRGRAEMRREWLQNVSGLIVLSGAKAGDVGQALMAGNRDAAVAYARQWQVAFPDSYYIELQRTEAEADQSYTQAALSVATELSLPVVATHPVQFLDRSDFRAHEARVCISEGQILTNPRRPRWFTEDQYLLSSDEMAKRFSDVPSALANSVAIAQRCNLTLELGQPQLPDFPTPEGVTLDDYLIQLSELGLEKRMVQLFPDPVERAKVQQQYSERLSLECQTIIKMGFPGYFLIVQDFINWGKSNGVPVGPGRGSGAGSLVAYSLGITDLDPIRYDLLFERFLNPERVSMPDFDIDFCQDNRERVIEYVKTKYGRSAVSHVLHATTVFIFLYRLAFFHGGHVVNPAHHWLFCCLGWCCRFFVASWLDLLDHVQRSGWFCHLVDVAACLVFFDCAGLFLGSTTLLEFDLCRLLVVLCFVVLLEGLLDEFLVLCHVGTF